MSEYIRRIIETTFVSTVTKSECNTELKRAVLSHERKNRYVDNLLTEICGSKKVFKLETIKEVTKDLTTVFIRNVERHANEKYMSDLEKSTVVQQGENAKLFDAIASKMADQIKVKTWLKQ